MPVRSLVILCASLVVAVSASSQQRSHVVISELSTRGIGICNSACEFVEWYNPSDDTIDLSNWKLQYRPSDGSGYNTLVTVPPTSSIGAHRFFLITNATWTGQVAGDLTWELPGIADNGTIRILDASGIPVDRVAFGAGNDPEGAAVPNHGEQPNNYSIERKASPSSTASTLASGGSDEHLGNGQDTDDNSADFIVQTGGRNPQNSGSPPGPWTSDGSGSSHATSRRLHAGIDDSLSIVFSPVANLELSDLRVIIPREVSWSRSKQDIRCDAGITAGIVVHDDTVTFERPTFTSDSCIITLLRQRFPTTTMLLKYQVLTRGPGGMFAHTQTQPEVVIIGHPVPIAEIRANDSTGRPVMLGAYACVRGVVTVAKEFDAPSFLQDTTGGIAVFDAGFSAAVSSGDSVIFTGKVAHFNGLTEMTDVFLEGMPIPGPGVVPTITTIQAILSDGIKGNERFEGTLIRLHNVIVNTSEWNVIGPGTNYSVSDGECSLDVRILSGTDLVNSAAPLERFDLVGILGQYKRSAPYSGGYQIMPRRIPDIITTGPYILTTPVEAAIAPTQITLEWTTRDPATAHARYWKTPADECNTVNTTDLSTTQHLVLEKLDPGTLYLVQPFSVAGRDTSFAFPMHVATRSASSTGTMNAAFNKTVDPSIYPSLPANGTVDLKSRLLDHIAHSRFSVDAALYSLSGAAGSEIAAALIDATVRGVRIRLVLEHDNSSSSAIARLRQQGIPMIFDDCDTLTAGAGLMHNKFLIIDARDRTYDTDDWVVTGSWNASDRGLNDDAQNEIEIQDQALAAVYTREFEEMWGGSTDMPSSGMSRFGASKSDNTPHHLDIAGTQTESWFSPSDRPTQRLISAIRRAKRSLYFSILTFTHADIARAMTDRMAEGVTVRGVFDNSTDQGSQFDYLRSAGADVLLKSGLSGLLHHKYLLIDADDVSPSADPVVITGSHNWSHAAEAANDENTLLIHSDQLARQYLQEWYSRYRDAGGRSIITLSVERDDVVAASPTLGPVYPNPVFTETGTRISLPFTVADCDTPLRLSLIDMVGREIAVLADGMYRPGRYVVTTNVDQLPSGMYTAILAFQGKRLTTHYLILR